MTDKKLVTVKEAAEMASLCTATVRKLVATDELEVVRIGRAVRVTVDSLDAFIERNRGVPASA